LKNAKKEKKGFLAAKKQSSRRSMIQNKPPNFIIKNYRFKWQFFSKSKSKKNMCLTPYFF